MNEQRPKGELERGEFSQVVVVSWIFLGYGYSGLGDPGWLENAGSPQAHDTNAKYSGEYAVRKRILSFILLGRFPLCHFPSFCITFIISPFTCFYSRRRSIFTTFGVIYAQLLSFLDSICSTVLYPFAPLFVH
ncbi:hypothetical protein EV361DRAFT_389969 [Lentinula raphanica]|nr:hypothetical protein EV361DRAFT_389969 [Lentinula raphanica]